MYTIRFKIRSNYLLIVIFKIVLICWGEKQNISKLFDLVDGKYLLCVEGRQKYVYRCELCYYTHAKSVW